jgi:hypothetical protein
VVFLLGNNARYAAGSDVVFVAADYRHWFGFADNFGDGGIAFVGTINGVGGAAGFGCKVYRACGVWVLTRQEWITLIGCSYLCDDFSHVSDTPCCLEK